MIKTVIIENEFQTAWHYPSKRLIKHQWHKYCAGEVFRDIMTKSADAFEQNKCFKWLSDDRNYAGAMHPDDIAWGREYWGPRMFKAGWKYHAMVLPEKMIGQMGLTAMVNWFQENGVQTKVFSDPDEAMAWLDGKGTLDINLTSQER